MHGNVPVSIGHTVIRQIGMLLLKWLLIVLLHFDFKYNPVLMFVLYGLSQAQYLVLLVGGVSQRRMTFL